MGFEASSTRGRPDFALLPRFDRRGQPYLTSRSISVAGRPRGLPPPRPLQAYVSSLEHPPLPDYPPPYQPTDELTNEERQSASRVTGRLYRSQVSNNNGVPTLARPHRALSAERTVLEQKAEAPKQIIAPSGIYTLYCQEPVAPFSHKQTSLGNSITFYFFLILNTIIHYILFSLGKSGMSNDLGKGMILGLLICVFVYAAFKTIWKGRHN